MGCNMFDIDLGGNWADELLEGMQGPGQREKMQAAFHATPKELGEAAVKAAQKSELGLLGDIQDIVKKSDQRNYGDGERKF